MVFLVGIGLPILTVVGDVSIYLDIPSLIIAGILPFLFTSILFGFKEMGSAFSVSIRKETEREALINALNFFKIYGKVTWIAGYIAVFIGVIAMLANLADKTAWGPYLALALFSLLYSGIINVVIIIPFTVFIKKQLKE
ncbi:MAG: hypothetical protein LBK43_00865 [Treponema sp.]|jgi:hypothetical protein|nr:hypothetical protein [Treponema sp.]